METKTLLRLVKDDISHLQGIASEFNLESLPTIEEVELALFRTNALLRQLELLHKAIVTRGDLAEIPKPDVAPRVEAPSNTASERIQNILVNEITEPEKPATPLEPKAVFAESEKLPIQEPESHHIQEQANIPEVTIPKPVVNNTEVPVDASVGESKIHHDSPDESQQLVNEILVQETSESGYPLIRLQSIRNGIGINDRHQFIRELFENSSTKFETTVSALDKLSTIQEAVNYLKLNFKWVKSDASHKFLVLVKRRFTN